ncbi:MAG TPA: hypothetical protein P5136_02610 [Methanofastidiosum sp.]|nr:hypothetical protein [Methanofastidiosum sp.]
MKKQLPSDLKDFIMETLLSHDSSTAMADAISEYVIGSTDPKGDLNNWLFQYKRAQSIH